MLLSHLQLFFCPTVTKHATVLFRYLVICIFGQQTATYESVDVAWRDQVEGAVIYPGSRPTVLRIHLRYLALVFFTFKKFV